MSETVYRFGCAAVTGKADWLVQSSSKNNQAQEALALRNDGEPVVAHYYQKISELAFEVIVPEGDSTFPEIGDVFTYEGVSYYVAGISKTETNTDFNRFSLTCKRFITTELPEPA